MEELKKASILEYAKYFTYDFDKLPLNEVDMAVFAKLSYYHFYVFFENKEKKIKIKDTNDENKIKELLKRIVYSSWDDEFYKAVLENDRFRNVSIINPIEINDEANDEQFSAVTFKLPTGEIIVTFRGTDTTLYGWRENINMATMSPIPSQANAKKYVETAAKLGKKLYIVGHSKGGNLAEYALAAVDEKIKKQVVNVYNFDGPYFYMDIQNVDFNSIQYKVKKFVPTDSIVGLLFENFENLIVINANDQGFNQHSLNKWIVDVDHVCFYRNNVNYLKYQLVIASLNEWFETTNSTSRNEILNFMYNLLLNDSFTDFRDITSSSGAKTGLKEFLKLSMDERAPIREGFLEFINIYRKNKKNSGDSQTFSKNS